MGFNEVDSATDIQHLDFSADIECESKLITKDGVTLPNCPSDGKATWIAHRVCCSDQMPVSLFCDECMGRRMAAPTLRCGICGGQISPGMAAYSSVERIK